MNAAADLAIARSAAARVWRYRNRMELEAAARFRKLAAKLTSFGASEAVIAMAQRASSDELVHADRCRNLVHHFGGSVGSSEPVQVPLVAPPTLAERDQLLYEVVALSCVTETLSTALLGVLVERARDSLTRSVLRSILRDEIGHSRLGWAFLAEEHSRGARDCVGEWLPAMLSSTVSDELFADADDANEFDRTLAGFGSLEQAERRRVVQETLAVVVFPGLDRFGIDTRGGRAWLDEKLNVEHEARPNPRAGAAAL
jgi:hypothetical protein